MCTYICIHTYIVNVIIIKEKEGNMGGVQRRIDELGTARGKGEWKVVQFYFN